MKRVCNRQNGASERNRRNKEESVNKSFILSLHVHCTVLYYDVE